MIDLKDFELFQVSKRVFVARIPWDTDFLISICRYFMKFELQKGFRFAIPSSELKWKTNLPMIMSGYFRFQSISGQMVGVWPTNETILKTFYGVSSFLLSDCDPFG